MGNYWAMEFGLTSYLTDVNSCHPYVFGLASYPTDKFRIASCLTDEFELASYLTGVFTCLSRATKSGFKLS